MKFYLYFKNIDLKRGDTLVDGKGRLVKIIKTYNRTWWRVFLHNYLKINIKINSVGYSMFKVKTI